MHNLLPDSQAIRERLARRFQAGSTDAFTLLSEIGQDCVGALQVLPDNVDPEPIQNIQAVPLSRAEVAQILRNTLAPELLGGRAEDDDFRISIDGAQEKTALLRLDGQWCRPHGSTPTTHISQAADGPGGQAAGRHAPFGGERVALLGDPSRLRSTRRPHAASTVRRTGTR